jgi:hypothetical protein
MRFALRVGVALAFAAALPANACPGPNIVVTTRYAPPWTSYPTLALLNAKYGRAGERTWLGSTSSRLQTDVTFRSSGLPQSLECTPATMGLDLSFAEHEVNVAAEIANLPCLNRVVLAHEMQHVALNKKMLEQLRPIVASYVHGRIPSVLRNVPAPQQGAAIAAFVDADLKGKIERYWVELSAQQVALDTTREYEKIAAACPVELAQLALALDRQPNQR